MPVRTRLIRFALSLALPLGVLVGTGASSATPSSLRSPQHTSTYLFAPQFGSNLISVFDLRTNKRVADIGLDGHAACCAYARPDGQKVFIVDGLDPYVTTLDVRTMTVEHKTKLLGTWGDRGSDLPNKGDIFWFSEIPEGHVEAIDAHSFDIVRQCPDVGNTLANSHDGRWLYTLNDSVLNVRSTKDCSILASAPLPSLDKTYLGLALFVSLDNKKVFAEYLGNPGLFQVIDVSSPLRPRYVTSIPLGSAPFIPAFTPNGKQLWVPNAGDGTVTVIDVASNRVVHTISTGRYVANVEFWKDRAYLSLADSSYPIPPSYAHGVGYTIGGVTVGSLSAPTSGQRTSRPGVDIPGEIVTYNTATYQPLVGVPTMKTPSASLVMEIATPRP